MITNRKKWVKIKEYRLETKNNDFIVTKEVEYVRIYAVLNKRDIDNGEEAEIIEGEYIGYVPIIVSHVWKAYKLKGKNEEVNFNILCNY